MFGIGVVLSIVDIIIKLRKGKELRDT